MTRFEQEFDRTAAPAIGGNVARMKMACAAAGVSVAPATLSLSR